MSRLFIFLLFTAITFAQTDYTPVRAELEQLLKDDFFKSTGISISIHDLTENQVIFERDSRKLLRPASNMKILTSAAGLLFLGEEYKFRTGLYYTGSVINETLYGDLYIKGGCDPDFTSEDLDSLVSSVSSLNIKTVTGKVYADLSMKDSLFWGNGWMWDDDPSTDAPYLSALNINDNAIKVFIKGGKLNEKALVRTEPVTRFVNIINETITSTRGPSLEVNRNWVYRMNDIKVSGRISPEDSVSVTLNIYSPENYFTTFFFENLKQQGIKVRDTIYYAFLPDNAIEIFTFERPFDSVLVNLNKTSDNLSAEMVLYALSAKNRMPANARGGLKFIDSLSGICGMDPSDYVFADGSGVSHYNLVSSELLLSVLRYFYYNYSELFKKLYNSFPAAGIDGTLRSRMKNTASQGNVHAKTGTLSGVSSLSGYLTTGRGNLLAFSVLIQNYKGNSSFARYIQDTICNILSEFVDPVTIKQSD
jgi:serine-type D-Ala-D-Ala carboxypeptidase/endopeptidase (penicillin-binding protein 4)